MHKTNNTIEIERMFFIFNHLQWIYNSNIGETENGSLNPILKCEFLQFYIRKTIFNSHRIICRKKFRKFAFIFAIAKIRTEILYFSL